MKKLITILTVVTFCQLSYGQLYMQTGAGADVSGAVPSAEIFFGGIIKDRFTISGGVQAFISSDVKAGGAAFQGRVGYSAPLSDRFVLQPYVGIGGLVRSTDNKALNSSPMIYGADLNYRTNIPQLLLYLNANAVGEQKVVSVGVKFLFINYSGISCR